MFKNILITIYFIMLSCEGSSINNPSSCLNDEETCLCPLYFSEGLEESINSIECYPNEFLFYTTTQQAGYVFQSVEIVLSQGNAQIDNSNCSDVNECDWVGAFNGNVCIGATQWNIDECNNGICSINLMGFDGSDLSQNYMFPGDIPTFKFYDVSENIYYDALPSSQKPWFNQGVYIISELLVQP